MSAGPRAPGPPRRRAARLEAWARASLLPGKAPGRGTPPPPPALTGVRWALGLLRGWQGARPALGLADRGNRLLGLLPARLGVLGLLGRGVVG